MMPWIEIDERRKRWQPEPGDRFIDERGIERTRSRQRPKPRLAAQQYVMTPRERQGEKAIDYAIWLANRDGIELPEIKRRGLWSRKTDPVQVRTEVDYVVLPDGRRDRRIKSVSWGRIEWVRGAEIYEWLKGTRREDELFERFIPIVSIQIPHWDHVPTVEEVETA